MHTQRLDTLLLAAHRSTLALLALGSLACATPKRPAVIDAAETPLKDLNLIYTKIPKVLVEAQKDPYLVPSDPSCAALDASVRALDEALGPDLDAPVSASNPGLIARVSNAAAHAAVGTVRRSAEDVVPFRNWVRALSGADRRSKHVAASIAAGTVRRAFLKGLRASKECT